MFGEDDISSFDCELTNVTIRVLFIPELRDSILLLFKD